MLHAFISENRDELIARARERVAQRKAPKATQQELDRGVPLFLTQLAALLRETMSRGEEQTARTLMDSDAGAHGLDMLAQGLTVAQVVHDYGDVCQVVTELAVEREVPIAAAEFRAFNRCLDDAIARAVTEYTRARERSIVAEGTERLGFLAHEMRNLVGNATLSFDTIKRGTAGTNGSVATIHARSLARLRDLIDRSLTEVRLDAAVLHREPVAVAELIEEAEITATIQAQANHLELTVPPCPPDLVVEIDRQVIAGALANLLQNAFKFTRPQGNVSLRTRATAERVCIEVEDQCGGLPAGKAEELFRPFEQRSANRTGLGLGLAIARRAVEANGGDLRVDDLPHVGCRFTIDLPRVPAHT
jgi:signal transduction histidine kinase